MTEKFAESSEFRWFGTK